MRKRLDSLMMGCFAAQKLYGRDPGNSGVITEMFHTILGKYPADKCMAAFELWLERSQEFPTPADIVGLIKRNGKPPIRESDIIAIRKKDGQDRTRDEWALLREWDKQQSERWSGSDYHDPEKETATLSENIRLRQRVKEQDRELDRMARLLSEARAAKGIEKPQPSVEEKVKATVAYMRETGAPASDIELFERQAQGVA